MMGKFAGRSKETCYKRFLEVDKEVLDAFTSLGKSESLPDESLISMLEKFVCILYGTKKHIKLNKLRWYLYSRKQAEGGNLPPTKSSANQHINRAHFMAMIWRRNMVNHRRLPSPEYYRWKNEGGFYTPL